MKINALLFLLLLFVQTFHLTLSDVGFNYALALQKHPLDTQKASHILKNFFPKVTKAKLFGSSPNDIANMKALFDNGMKEVTLAITQHELWDGNQTHIDSNYASHFVQTVILPNLPNLPNLPRRIHIAIGNEPFASWHQTPPMILLNAYETIRQALIDQNIKNQVSMTVPFQFGILENTYPPTAATIVPKYQTVISKLLEYMIEDDDYFDINIYPYFAYRDNTHVIPLEYALGTSPIVASDGITYQSLLHAMYSAAQSAIAKIQPHFKNIVIGETGWPTEDTPFPTESNPYPVSFSFANNDNAKTFIQQAIQLDIPMYLFEAFDESLKSQDNGAGGQFSNVENHWGIFTESGQLKFDILELQDQSNSYMFMSNMITNVLKASIFVLPASTTALYLFHFI